MIKDRIGTKVITGIVKLAYTHIFEPYAIEEVEGYEPRYSTTVIIPKNDTETLEAINNDFNQRKIAFVKYWAESSSPDNSGKGNIKTPIRDGDLERPGDPLYKDCYFLNANSKNKPGVVDANVNTIVESIEVKNGCYARVSLNFYGYSSNGNKGVAAGLNNIQLLGGFQ